MPVVSMADLPSSRKRDKKKKDAQPVFRDWARMTGNVSEAPDIPDPAEFKKRRPKPSMLKAFNILGIGTKVSELDPFGRRRRSELGGDIVVTNSVNLKEKKRVSTSILQLPPFLYKAEMTKEDSRMVVINDDVSVESASHIDEETPTEYSETLSPLPPPPVATRDPSGRRKKDRFSLESLGKITVSKALEPVPVVDEQHGAEVLARWVSEKGKLTEEAAYVLAEKAYSEGITTPEALLEELQNVLDDDPETPYFALSDLVRERLQELGCPRKLLPKLCVALQKFKEAPRSRDGSLRLSRRGRQSEGGTSSLSSAASSKSTSASQIRRHSGAPTPSVPASSTSSLSSISDPVQFKRTPPGPPRTVEMLAIITSLGDDLIIPRARIKSSGRKSTGTLKKFSSVEINKESLSFSERYGPAFKDVRKVVQPTSPTSPVRLPPPPSAIPKTPPPPETPAADQGVPPPPSYFPPTPSGLPTGAADGRFSPALADIPAAPVFFPGAPSILGEQNSVPPPLVVKPPPDPPSKLKGSFERPLSAPPTEYASPKVAPPHRRESNSAKLRRDPSHREFIRDTAERAQRVARARGERELKTTQQVKVMSKLLRKPAKGQSWSDAGMKVKLSQPRTSGGEANFRSAHLHIATRPDGSESPRRGHSPRRRESKRPSTRANRQSSRRNVELKESVDDSMSDVSDASDVGLGTIPQELRWVECRKYFFGGREEGSFPLDDLLSVEELDGGETNTFVLETADHRILRIQMVDKTEAAKAFRRAGKHIAPNSGPGESSVLAKSASQQIRQLTAMLIAGFRALLLLQIENDPLRQTIEARRRVISMMQGRSWGIGRPLIERSWTVDAALAALAQVNSSLESKTSDQFDPLGSSGMLPSRKQDAKLSQVTTQMQVSQNLQRRQGRAFSRLGGAKALLGILYRFKEHTDVVITGLRALTLLIDAWPGTGVLPLNLSKAPSLQSEIASDSVAAENPMYTKGRHRKGTRSWDARQMCSFLEGAAQQLADYGAVECIMAVLNVHGANVQVLGATADVAHKLVLNTEDSLVDFRKVGLPELLQGAIQLVTPEHQDIHLKIQRCLSCFSDGQANVAVIVQTYAQPFNGSRMLKKSKQHHRHNNRKGQEDKGGSGDSNINS